MDFDTHNSASSAAAALRQQTSTTVNAKTTTTEVSEDKTRLIDEIREKGFSAFLQEMKEQKLKELREEILRSMGLDEEALQNMPPEQRAQIEKMINQEIMERMVANAEMNTKNGTILAKLETVQMEVTQVTATSIVAGGVGMGPLLALQEAELQALDKGTEPDEDAG